MRAAASAADWVAIETRQTRISARVRPQARHGARETRPGAAALDSGAVNVAQARVIVTALDRLPGLG